MSRRSVFTTITPLPPNVTRETVLETLHNHVEMIDLNPLVEERHIIKPPRHASAEEYHCVWYSIQDKVHYIPGGGVSGHVTYTAAFHDLPMGIQTHCYAPLGVDIRAKWLLCGSLPGEPAQPTELGIGAPLQGLYLREDVDLRCNFLMSSFVKKTLRKAHEVLKDRLVVKTGLLEAVIHNERLTERASSGASTPTAVTHSGSSIPLSPPLSVTSPRLAASVSDRASVLSSNGSIRSQHPEWTQRVSYQDLLRSQKSSPAYAPPDYTEGAFQKSPRPDDVVENAPAELYAEPPLLKAEKYIPYNPRVHRASVHQQSVSTPAIELDAGPPSGR